ALTEVLFGGMLAVQLGLQGAEQHVVDERALSRAGHARDGGDRPERNAHVDVLEVVLARSGQREPAGTEAAPLARDRDLAGVGELRAERIRQSNALGLAAGQRARGAIE